MRRIGIISVISVMCVCGTITADARKRVAEPKKPIPAERWSEEKANAWYEQQDWPVGCVFVPSNTGTPVEMWAAEYFDEALIDRELGLAEGLGFNAIRLFMCDIVWQNDRDGFMERLEKYIALADKHGMKLLLTFFTNGGTIKNPYLGAQPQPVPGIHNSVWMSSPGRDVINNPARWPLMEEYVKCVIGKYKEDPRILAWCLYNEPENTDTFNTLPFIEAVYRWAREVNPSQPLTSPIWNLPGASNSFMPIQAFVLANSDVISFHCYSNYEVCSRHIALLKPFNRPIICSEWMARTRGSDFYTILPLFKRNKIACFSYGLVNGKQQCHYPWNDVDKDGNKIPFTEEPPIWFHDIFYPDGTPWNQGEVQFIRSLTKKKAGLSVNSEPYGILSTGQQAHVYLLSNSMGASAKLTDYGARIISIRVPDRNGCMGDVIVGPDDLQAFESEYPERFLGCVIGRYGICHNPSI